MLYDRLAGLPTEHEHITGALVRAAQQHDIPVPLNKTLLTLMRAVRPMAVPGHLIRDASEPPQGDAP